MKADDKLIQEAQALAIQQAEVFAQDAIHLYLVSVAGNQIMTILKGTGVLDPKAKVMEILVKKAKEEAFK